MESLQKLLFNNVRRQFVTEQYVEIQPSQLSAVIPLRHEGAESQLDVWKDSIEVFEFSRFTEIKNFAVAIDKKVIGNAKDGDILNRFEGRHISVPSAKTILKRFWCVNVKIPPPPDRPLWIRIAHFATHFMQHHCPKHQTAESTGSCESEQHGPSSAENR